ncbi:Histone-lysine N-methyltransferase SUVR5 [Linum perenne]
MELLPLDGSEGDSSPHNLETVDIHVGAGTSFEEEKQQVENASFIASEFMQNRGGSQVDGQTRASEYHGGSQRISYEYREFDEDDSSLLHDTREPHMKSSTVEIEQTNCREGEHSLYEPLALWVKWKHHAVVVMAILEKCFSSFKTIRSRANACLKKRIQATKLLSSMDLNVQPRVSDPTALGRVSLKASLGGKYGLLPERFYLKAAKLCSELNVEVEWHHEGRFHTYFGEMEFLYIHPIARLLTGGMARGYIFRLTRLFISWLEVSLFAVAALLYVIPLRFLVDHSFKRYNQKKAKGYDVSKVLLTINVASKWRFVAFPKGYRVCYLLVYLELVDSETMPSECSVVNQHKGSLSVQKSNLFVALVETTGNRGLINLINGADFWVTAIVELLGLVICLHVATKVSHRAQGIVSMATRWHSVSTNETTSQMEVSSNGGGMEAPLPTSSGLLPPNLLGD